MITKEAILAKTHSGTGIYSHILREYYPDETIMVIRGRDCGICKNPYNAGEPTLHIWIERLQPEKKLSDEKARHRDTSGNIPDGDCFDFAALFYRLDAQPLLDRINQDLRLHLEDGYSPYGPVKDRRIITGPKFSIFDPPITNTRPRGETSLGEVFDLLTGESQNRTTAILRNISDKKQARLYKATHFAYCTFSGIFKTRSDKDLKQHSGLLCIDFDHVPDRQALRNHLLEDTYFETQLLFTSPSGDGLKWIIPIDPLKVSHADYFRAVSAYIKETYGIEADQSGKDVSRACFIPSDPDAYINPIYRNQ